MSGVGKIAEVDYEELLHAATVANVCFARSTKTWRLRASAAVAASDKRLRRSNRAGRRPKQNHRRPRASRQETEDVALSQLPGR
jgi:hypothetical protein